MKTPSGTSAAEKSVIACEPLCIATLDATPASRQQRQRSIRPSHAGATRATKHTMHARRDAATELCIGDRDSMCG
jgi:hypothetical protein